MIATQIPDHDLTPLGRACWERSIPLVVVRAYGFLGTVRLALRDHCIVESNPDNAETAIDLRLATPFPALQARLAALARALPDMEPAAIGHLPYPVLLFAALERWRAAHAGAAPCTFAEKEAFKASIKLLPHARDGAGDLRENFSEATREYYRAYKEYELTPELREVLADPRAASTASDTPSFWVLAAALRDFMTAAAAAAAAGAGAGAGAGLPSDSAALLPVSGTLPDMTASTDAFLELQRLYADKAAADVAALAELAAARCAAAGQAPSAVDMDTVRRFCKNAARLQVLRCRSLEEEAGVPSADIADAFMLDERQHCPMRWYVMLRASDAFLHAQGRSPGQLSAVAEESMSDAGAGDSDAAALAADAALLAQHARAAAARLGVEQSAQLTPEHAVEMCRYGGPLVVRARVCKSVRALLHGC